MNPSQRRIMVLRDFFYANPLGFCKLLVVNSAKAAANYVANTVYEIVFHDAEDLATDLLRKVRVKVYK